MKVVLSSLVLLLLSVFASPLARAAPASARLNILLITADDMNYDTPGCMGGTVPDLTPNIDRLAREGILFRRAHVVIGVCQPCREALMTGRYPHNNGGEGFQPIRADVPTLQEALHAAGYLNGIMGKNSHLQPIAKFCWDFERQPAQLGGTGGRDPAAYHRSAREFFESARAAGRPFFLMANSHDPHRPFPGSAQERKTYPGAAAAAVRRTVAAADAVIPGFLPDLPGVRTEVAQYLTAAHRCDETVGAVLRALDEAGLRDTTLVMFLSDNGMSFPFAKANVYLTSTRTPWIARWPGKIQPGAVDADHFISGIDFMPTILAAAGLPATPGMDGRSFLPLLLGRPQADRDLVFTEFHETSGHNRYPMRCVQTARFGYVFNPWADGSRVMRNESQNGLSFPAMQVAAPADPGVARRVDFFQHRTLEEFYDFQNDPSALHNLIANPRYRDEIQKLRAALAAHLHASGDEAAEAFDHRDSPDALRRFMAAEDAKSRATRAARRVDAAAEKN